MEALEWARVHGAPSDEPDLVSDYPWARVTRLGDVWLKECAPVQAYEVPLTVALVARWPDRVPAVLAADTRRGWLLLADAGSPVAAFGDVRDALLAMLPLYAELQQAETRHADAHLAAGVPDQRPHVVLEGFEAFGAFRDFAPRFREHVARLTLPPTVQHDDLHRSNIYARDGRIVVIDWGDTVIAHPFASLLNLLRGAGDDAALYRDAYLDAWPAAHRDEFDAAFAVAAFARILSWQRIGETEPLERNVEWFREHILHS